MPWFEHNSKHPAASELAEKRYRCSDKLFAVSDQHPAEVVFLEMAPNPFDVVQLFGRVGGKPEYADEPLYALDLRETEFGSVGRPIVDHQHDPSARAPGALFHHLKHADKEGGVDALKSVREQERAVRPLHRSTNCHSGVLTRRRDPERLTPLAVGVDRDGQQVEPDAIGEPEFVIGSRSQSPFFRRLRAFWARFLAARFCKFRIVRLVLRQTIPCWRNSSDTQAGVNQIPVVSPRYCAKRGAVQRVKTYPNSRGSRGSSRSIAWTYREVALGGRPERSPSSNPKNRCLSHRRFQRNKVVRAIASDSRILSVGTPAHNRRIAVIRSLARPDFALRRCCLRNLC